MAPAAMRRGRVGWWGRPACREIGEKWTLASKFRGLRGLRGQNARAVTVGILVTWENARPDRSGAPNASEFRRKCPTTRKECARPPPSSPSSGTLVGASGRSGTCSGSGRLGGGGRASAAAVRGPRGGRAPAAAVREGGGMRSGAPLFPADLPRSRRLRVGRALAGRVPASRQEAGARALGAFPARPGCTQKGEDGHRRRSRAGRASGPACVRCEI